MKSITQSVKRNGVIGPLKKSIHKCMKWATVLTFEVLPVQKRCVLFNSFDGMYNDNPRIISERLHDALPDYKIYWAITEACHEAIPDYIHAVRYDSLEYWALTAKAQVAVDWQLGIRNRWFCKNMWASRMLSSVFCMKLKKQLNITTWHGTPIKKVGAYFKNAWKGGSIETTGLKSSSDYILAGCEFTKLALEVAAVHAAPIRLYGTPRNDVLIKGNCDVERLKKKLHLPDDKKIVLFAPTWRFSVERSGLDQIRTIDVQTLLNRFAEVLHGECALVLRVHPRVLKDRRYGEFVKQCGDAVINGNLGDDMSEYIVCSDALITDYSSSMADYALTGKPCFVYVQDKEQYDAEQGMDEIFEKLPFQKAKSPQELLDCIASFDQNDYEKKARAFLSKLGNAEDGRATERVVNDICRFIESNNKDFLNQPYE